MLRIGLDARATEPGFKAHYGRGTGRYAAELLKRLVKPEAGGDSCQVIPVLSEDLRGSSLGQQAMKLLPFGRMTAETQLFLPRRLGQIKADCLHFVAHGDATARCPLPYIITVLDLIPLRFPDLYKAKRPGWRFNLARNLERQAIEGACGIIAISEATKRDVVELIGVPEDKVFVTHLGVSEQFQPRSVDWQKEAQALKTKYGLPLKRPLLLYTGGVDPRKNLIFLLQTFAAVLEHPFLERPMLVLAGNYQGDEEFPKVQAEIQRLGLTNDVRLLGYVPEEDLPGLFRSAHLSVLPSLYEGFGLPVLEAMACGVPVVAGNNSSIPEVAGNAAVLVKDSDIGLWKAEICSILLNETRQGQLSQAGKNQARRFSWDSTAEQTLAAYEYFWNRRARGPMKMEVSVETLPRVEEKSETPEAESEDSAAEPAAGPPPSIKSDIEEQREGEHGI